MGDRAAAAAALEGVGVRLCAAFQATFLPDRPKGPQRSSAAVCKAHVQVK